MISDPAPKRTAYTGPVLSGPGLIFTTSKITAPASVLPTDLYTKWYEQVHIPDMLATGGVMHASRYQCIDPDVVTPYLALYKLHDLGFMQDPAFKKVKMGHEILPEGGPVHRFVEFDTRFYELIQTYELKQLEEAFTHTIISAEMEPRPGGEDDLDAWYRDEHCEQMSHEPGWVRTTRYRLVFQVKNLEGKSAPDAPTWLALHEFDETNKLGTRVQPLQPETEWTKRIVSAQKDIKAATFRLLKGFDV